MAIRRDTKGIENSLSLSHPQERRQTNMQQL